MKYNGKRKAKSFRLKPGVKKIIIGIAAIALVGGKTYSEYNEYQEKDEIIENAKLDVIRNFNHLDREKAGKYLQNELVCLDSKYPNLADQLLEENEKLTSPEFCDDIYRLYKAYMVDKTKKNVENMDNITVNQAETYMSITTMDQIRDNDKLIDETHKEQDKQITELYCKAQKNPELNFELAKQEYELLAEEIGLKERTATSQEIAQMMDEQNFYYDIESQSFYTKQGKAHLVLDGSEQLKTNSQTIKDSTTDHGSKNMAGKTTEEDKEDIR